MDPAAAKQQIIDRINKATNVLVTVNANPTVDELAAALGFTLVLNRLQKHATAIFSGKIPSTIEFLKPEKTFETTTDSLRDFIISLDKDKADKLRYKIEGDTVKVYITPYKTSLSEKDLTFELGDFNVELVVGLGVKDKAQMDAAITAHGRILHDATVISLNTGSGKAPEVGQVNWLDASASSLSEIAANLSQTLGQNLIDNQSATAFLTGIVAETDRFSNAKTSPKVMTLAAQLMAAGANQQLIINKLTPPAPAAPAAAPKAAAKSAPAPAVKAELEGKQLPEKKDGTLEVKHDNESVNEVEVSSSEIHIDEEGNLKTAEELKAMPPPTPEPPKTELKEEPEPEKEPEVVPPHLDTPAEPKKEEQASKDDESEMPGSHAVLNPATKSPFIESAFTANTQPEWQNSFDEAPIDPLGGDGPGDEMTFEHKKVIQPLQAPKPTVTAQAKPVDTHVNQARNAVESALASAPANPMAAAPAQTVVQPTVEPTVVLPNVGGQAPPPVPPPLPNVGDRGVGG